MAASFFLLENSNLNLFRVFLCYFVVPVPVLRPQLRNKKKVKKKAADFEQTYLTYIRGRAKNCVPHTSCAIFTLHLVNSIYLSQI